MTEKPLELVRGLGAWASAAIVVGTMIGTGIFLKPAEMAREGRSVSVVFAAWIIGAILSIFGAFSFAELGSMIPEAGGEYAYLRRGFGPVYGFLFGWMHSIVGRPSSLASIAAGMMRFLSFLLPSIALPLFTVHIAIPGLTGWIKPYDFVFTWAQPLAVVWLLIMTGINYLGVRLGDASRGTLGLRWLGGPQPRRLRSGKPAQEFPARPRRRSRICRCNLSIVQRSLFEGAVIRDRCHIAAHRLRRCGAHQRRHRRELDHLRHGHLRSGLDEFLGTQRSTCRLRHGSRRNLFQDRWWHPSEIPHARTLADIPGRSGKFDGPHGNLRRTYKSVYFCRLDILWCGRGRNVSHAQDRARFAPPLPLLGLPLGPRHLRCRCPRADRKYLDRPPGPLVHRPAPDSRWTSLLSPLEPVALSCQQRCGKLAAAREEIAPASRRQEAQLPEPRSNQSPLSEERWPQY